MAAGQESNANWPMIRDLHLSPYPFGNRRPCDPPERSGPVAPIGADGALAGIRWLDTEPGACKNMLVGIVCLIGRVATAAPIGGVVVSIVSPGKGTEAEMWGQRSSRLDPDRAGDQGPRRPERVRGVSSRHRRHRPGVECLEDRRLLSAITEFPLPAGAGSSPGDLDVTRPRAATSGSHPENVGPARLRDRPGSRPRAPSPSSRSRQALAPQAT